ncbi:MAG: hypothetical protein U0271_31440 [Polyangiaceae bacterium]
MKLMLDTLGSRPSRSAFVRAATLFAAALLASACGDDTSTGGAGGSPSGGNGSGASSSGGSGDGGTAQQGGGGSSGTAGSSSGGSGQGGDPGTGGSGGGTPNPVPDPNLDGPYSTSSVDDSINVAGSGDTVPLTAYYPVSGPNNGPYPLVVIAHGFQLPASQYTNYATRLASFGYVAVLADYPTSFFGLSHVDVATDLLASVDWALADATVGGLIDSQKIGMTGHSLGGKTSLLAATMDSRVRAVIGIDPVDSSMNCSAADCPDVSMLMPTLAIPTGFVGETTDSGGGFQPCAPAADNYATFYAGAQAPSFSVTVNGANHMSFLDDVASCGFTCSFCQTATADNATVNDLAVAYVTAFFERRLRNLTAYDDYLTGATAQARYVTPGLATITSK